MKLNLNAVQQAKLLKYLAESPDSEQLGANEFVADFYDVEAPITVNFLIAEDGAIEIAAAAELLYDEGEDGWYMGDRIDDEARLLATLTDSDAI